MFVYIRTNIEVMYITKGIYCYIDNKNNDIVYVGKDSSIDKNVRHKSHLSPSRYNYQKINQILQNNIDRYSYHILAFDVDTEERLNALEIQYIRQLKPKFNFTEGGDGIKGWKHSEDTKINKISKTISHQRNTTGFYRVSKAYDKNFKKGFRWRYCYCENRRQRNINSINLSILKQKVLDKNLPWEILDEIKAKKSLEDDKIV